MFNAIVDRDALVTALSYLAPTVGNNSTNVGDDCILLQSLGNSTTIRMYTTNTIEFTEIELAISGGGATVDVAPPIEFKRFRSIVESIPEGDQITISTGPGEVILSFDMKQTPITLAGSRSGMLSLPKISRSNSSLTISRMFIDSVLSRIPKMLDDNPSMPLYNCMRIATTNYDVEVTAIDAGTKRIYFEEFSGGNMNPDDAIFVEAKKLSKSMKLFQEYDDIDFIMDNSMIRISGNQGSYNHKHNSSLINDISYYCRRLSGNYPTNLKKRFYPLPNEWLYLHCEEFTQILSRAVAITDRVDDSILFEVKNEEVSIRKTTQYGKVNDEAESDKKYTQSHVSHFSANQLYKFMKMMPPDTTNIMFAPLPGYNTQYFILKPESGGNFMFLVPCLQSGSNTASKPSTTTPTNATTTTTSDDSDTDTEEEES